MLSARVRDRGPAQTEWPIREGPRQRKAAAGHYSRQEEPRGLQEGDHYVRKWGLEAVEQSHRPPALKSWEKEEVHWKGCRLTQRGAGWRERDPEIIAMTEEQSISVAEDLNVNNSDEYQGC